MHGYFYITRSKVLKTFESITSDLTVLLCICIKYDVVMKDLEADGEAEKNEESTTPTDVNVSFETVIVMSDQHLR